MKKEKRIKKQLTSKQAGIISVAIAIVCGMIYFWLPYSKGEEIYISGLLSFIIGIVIYMFCYSFVLRGDKREHKERQEAVKAELKKSLSTGELTELIFTPENNGSETTMVLGILEKQGCRFFAKFNENEKIILIVYDKDEKEVWKEEIVNYFYFDSRFKQKK